MKTQWRCPKGHTSVSSFDTVQATKVNMHCEACDDMVRWTHEAVIENLEHDWQFPSDIMERAVDDLVDVQCRRCGYVPEQFYAFRWQEAIEHQTLNNPHSLTGWSDLLDRYPELLVCKPK
jgi:uncharacterized Zn finger protein